MSTVSTSSQTIIEIGKALLPYLRSDLRPEELGMAAHDAVAALRRCDRVGLSVVERSNANILKSLVDEMLCGNLTKDQAVKAIIHWHNVAKQDTSQ